MSDKHWEKGNILKNQHEVFQLSHLRLGIINNNTNLKYNSLQIRDFLKTNMF